MLQGRKNSEQFQRMHLASVTCWCVAVSHGKKNVFPIFKKIISNEPSPSGAYFAILPKFSSLKHQSTMQTKLPSQDLMQEDPEDRLWVIVKDNSCWASPGQETSELDHRSPGSSDRCTFCQTQCPKNTTYLVYLSSVWGQRLRKTDNFKLQSHRYKLLDPNYLDFGAT